MVGQIALAAADLLDEGLLDLLAVKVLAGTPVEFGLAVGRGRTRKLFLAEIGKRQTPPVAGFYVSRAAATLPSVT